MFKFLHKILLTIIFAAFASQASAMFIQPDTPDPNLPGVGTNRYAYSGDDPVNLSDPTGNSWLDQAWDSVFGENSFNKTFGDAGSSWSDHTFGNGGEQVTSSFFNQGAGGGSSYSDYKSRSIEKNSEISEKISSDAIGQSHIDIDIALAITGITEFRAGYAMSQAATRAALLELESIALRKAATEASTRLGIDLAKISIENGVAKSTISLSKTLKPEDMKAVADFLRSQGAVSGELNTGYIANERLMSVLERAVGRGPQTTFGGGTVSRVPAGGFGDFIIGFRF